MEDHSYFVGHINSSKIGFVILSVFLSSKTLSQLSGCGSFTTCPTKIASFWVGVDFIVDGLVLLEKVGNHKRGSIELW